jgi:hypothetical protein
MGVFVYLLWFDDLRININLFNQTMICYFHYQVGVLICIVRHYLIYGIWLPPWYLQFVLIVYFTITSCIGIGYLFTNFWVSIDMCGLKQRIVLNRTLINKGWWNETVTVNNSTNIKKTNNYHSDYFYFLACFAASTKN